jgi:hypothetical protein
MIDLFINLLDAVFTSFQGAIRGVWERRNSNAGCPLWILIVGGFLIGIGIIIFLAVVLMS